MEKQPIGPHVEYGPREALAERYYGGALKPSPRSQIKWAFDYIDSRYGTRRSRVRRHLRNAWREVRAAMREFA